MTALSTNLKEYWHRLEERKLKMVDKIAEKIVFVVGLVDVGIFIYMRLK